MDLPHAGLFAPFALKAVGVVPVVLVSPFFWKALQVMVVEWLRQRGMTERARLKCGR